MGGDKFQGVLGSVVQFQKQEQGHDVVAYQISRREFCEGFEGSSRGRHAGPNYEGTRNEELFGGKGERSSRERGRMEGRARPKRGRNSEAGSSFEDGEGEFREGKERFDGNGIKSRSTRWCFGNYC